MRKIILLLLGSMFFLLGCGNYGIYNDNDLGISFEIPADYIFSNNGVYTKANFDCDVDEEGSYGLCLPEIFLMKESNISLDDYISPPNPNYAEIYDENPEKYIETKFVGDNEFILLDHRNFDEGGCSYYFAMGEKDVLKLVTSLTCFESDIWEEYKENNGNVIVRFLGSIKILDSI